jgi:predicted O-methyltransferase YrrM
LALQRTDVGHFVEIGTYRGRSAAYLGVEIHNLRKNIKVDTIDHYGESFDHSANSTGAYEIVIENLKPLAHIVNVIMMDSILAAKEYKDNSLDLVYIDASHDYESVKSEIEIWLPKVKKGGIISGDDFGWLGVKEAVKNTLPKAIPIGHNDSNWYFIVK